VPERIDATALIERYEALLIDAYGVLVDSSGPLDGAARFLDELRAADRPFWIVTNDASKLPQTCAERFGAMGLSIAPEQVVTSGSLLEGWFAERGLGGAKTIVLGPPDSVRYVELAGGVVVDAHADVDVVVIGDESGYPFLETIDDTLTALYRALDRAEPPALVVPNPDLVYPKAAGEFGLASGSIALMLEAAMRARHGDASPVFTRLGKPNAPIFEAAIERAGTRNVVMIGDQLQTDIAGANGVGIDSALVDGGVARWQEGSTVEPTYLLSITQA